MTALLPPECLEPQDPLSTMSEPTAHAPMIVPRVLRSGYADLDAFDIIRDHGLTILAGEVPRDVLYGYVVDATRTGEVLFVDGANSMRGGLLAEAATRRGEDAELVLDAVLMGRSFTAYQFQTLLETELPARVGQGVSLVVVTGFSETYMDRDLPAKDKGFMAPRAWAALRSLAERLPIIATTPGLDAPFVDAADETVEFTLTHQRGRDPVLTAALPQRGARVLVRGPRSRQTTLPLGAV